MIGQSVFCLKNFSGDMKVVVNAIKVLKPVPSCVQIVVKLKKILEILLRVIKKKTYALTDANQRKK